MRDFKDLKIAVAGTGYVGLSIATLLSQHHKVMAVDIVPEKVELINSKKSPIQDEYSYTISLAKNREIAEEITQDTFYKAVSTTSQFKGKSDELTWLCSIAKNLYHDEMRSRQRVADVSEINDLPSNENVENSVTDSDMAFRIHLVLHRLEEPYKEVFQLRVFGELSFAQIAAIFGKTESWARVTYHRAKLKIQERMD